MPPRRITRVTPAAATSTSPTSQSALPLPDPRTLDDTQFTTDYFDPKYLQGQFTTTMPGDSSQITQQSVKIYAIDAYQDVELHQRWNRSFDLGYLTRKYEQVYWLDFDVNKVPASVYSTLLGSSPSTHSLNLSKLYPIDSLEAALDTSALVMLNDGPEFDLHLASQLSPTQLSALSLPPLFSNNLSLTSLNNAYLIHYSLGIPPPIKFGKLYSCGYYLPVKRSATEIYDLFPQRSLMPIVEKLVQPRLVKQCYNPNQPDSWRAHFRDTVIRSQAQQNFLLSNDLMTDIGGSAEYHSFWHRVHLFIFLSRVYFRSFNPASHAYHQMIRDRKKQKRNAAAEARVKQTMERYGVNHRTTRRSAHLDGQLQAPLQTQPELEPTQAKPSGRGRKGVQTAPNPSTYEEPASTMNDNGDTTHSGEKRPKLVKRGKAVNNTQQQPAVTGDTEAADAAHDSTNSNPASTESFTLPITPTENSTPTPLQTQLATPSPHTTTPTTTQTEPPSSIPAQSPLQSNQTTTTRSTRPSRHSALSTPSTTSLPTPTATNSTPTTEQPKPTPQKAKKSPPKSPASGKPVTKAFLTHCKTRFSNSPKDFGIPFASPWTQMNLYNPLNYQFFDYLPKSEQNSNIFALPTVISPYQVPYESRKHILQNVISNHQVVSQAMETLLLHGFPMQAVGKFNLHRHIHHFSPILTSSLNIVTSFQLGYLRARHDFQAWNRQFTATQPKAKPTSTKTATKTPQGHDDDYDDDDDDNDDEAYTPKKSKKSQPDQSQEDKIKFDPDDFQIPTHSPHPEQSWFMEHYPVAQNPAHHGVKWSYLSQLGEKAQELHRNVEVRRLKYYQQQTTYRLHLATTYLAEFELYKQREDKRRRDHLESLKLQSWTKFTPPPPYTPGSPPDVIEVVKPLIQQWYNLHIAQQQLWMNQIRTNTTSNAIIPPQAFVNISPTDISTFLPGSQLSFVQTESTPFAISTSLSSQQPTPTIPRLNHDMIYNLQALTTPLLEPMSTQMTENQPALPELDEFGLPTFDLSSPTQTNPTKINLGGAFFDLIKTKQMTQHLRSLSFPFNYSKSMLLQYSHGDRSEPTFFWPLTKNTYVYPVKKPPVSEVGKCKCTTGSCLFNPKCDNYRRQNECPAACPRGKHCQNNRLRKSNGEALAKRVEIRRTGERGFGLYLKQPVKRGELLLEYLGEVINTEEMVQRLNEYTAAGSANFYILSVGKDLHVDAARKGNLGRFLNHSCDPVCYSERWEINNQAPREGIFALYDLPAGIELTFDYRMEAPPGSEHLEPVACLCETERCSGYLTARSKPRNTQRELIVRQVSIYIEYLNLILGRLEWFIQNLNGHFDPLPYSTYKGDYVEAPNPPHLAQSDNSQMTDDINASPHATSNNGSDGSTSASLIVQSPTFTVNPGSDVVQTLRTIDHPNYAYKTPSRRKQVLLTEYKNAVRLAVMLRKLIPPAVSWCVDCLQKEQPQVEKFRSQQRAKTEAKLARLQAQRR